MNAGRGADRAEAFLRDVEAIPATLDRLRDHGTAASVKRGLDLALRGGPTPRRVLLTGLGSSRFAALVAESAFRAAGLDVVVAPASALATVRSQAASPGATLTIAVSNGGRTPEVVAAASRAHAVGPVLAVTRDPGSPLAAAAGAVIALPIEAEESGVAITSFVATIGVLLQAAAALGAASTPGAASMLDAGKAAAAARAVLEAREAWLPPAMATLGPAEEVAVLAPWPLIGVAEQAALLLREGPRRTAAAFETAEWLHTGVYTALPGTAVVLLEGSDADAEVERTVTGRGTRFLRLPPGREIDGLAGITAPAILAAERWRTMPPEPRTADRPR